MSRRRKIILAIVALVVLIILVIFLFSFLSKGRPREVNVSAPMANIILVNQVRLGVPTINTNAAGVTVNVNAGAGPGIVKEGLSLEDNLKKIASNFAERFGSFSNQNKFENLRDLEVFMSEKMKAWVDNFILESETKAADTSVYYGITTKAIRTDLVSLDEKAGKAEVLVSTQRWEAKGITTNIRVFYQNISIKFVFENKEWKVDEALWK